MSAVTILDALGVISARLGCLDGGRDLHGEQLDSTAAHTGNLRDHVRHAISASRRPCPRRREETRCTYESSDGQLDHACGDPTQKRAEGGR